MTLCRAPTTTAKFIILTITIGISVRCANTGAVFIHYLQHVALCPGWTLVWCLLLATMSSIMPGLNTGVVLIH